MSEQVNSLPLYETLPINESLSLMQLQPADAERMFSLVDADREYLGKWLPWAYDTLSAKDSEHFIELMVKNRAERSEYGYGIILNGLLVGHASLMHLNDGQEAEIGYWISSSAAGKGVTTEVARTLTTFGFNTLGLPKIVIKADQRNIPSNKIAEKLGYQIERTENSEHTNRLVNVWSKFAPSSE